MSDVCTTGDTAHIDTIFKLLPHTRQHVERVWQEREYRIDVCRITRGAHIEHLYLSKKTFSVFLWL
jgi:endoglucanase Acf2